MTGCFVLVVSCARERKVRTFLSVLSRPRVCASLRPLPLRVPTPCSDACCQPDRSPPVLAADGAGCVLSTAQHPRHGILSLGIWRCRGPSRPGTCSHCQRGWPAGWGRRSAVARPARHHTNPKVYEAAPHRIEHHPTWVRIVRGADGEDCLPRCVSLSPACALPFVVSP